MNYDSWVAYYFSGQGGPSLVNIMDHDWTPGSVQAYLSDCGYVIGPSIAHYSCALYRWRWILLQCGALMA